MQTSERLSLEQIQAFLEGSGEVGFEGQNREEVYGWVNQTLRQQRYEELKRSGRGLVRRYVEKMTGLSRAQTTRLITVYLRGRGGEAAGATGGTVSHGGIRGRTSHLLAGVDEAHGTLSGPATQKLLQRACYNFGDARYQRLAQISVAQLYRLRRSRAYRERRIQYQATRPTAVSIGERRKPEPQGRPGYLRIDTVHQGDQDGVKGVYHINAVDEVTQWEVVGAVAQISEAWLHTGAGGDAGAVSVPHSGLSFRQRQRVHQPHGGQAAEQAAHRADQIAAAALQRQRAGGGQEWRGGPGSFFNENMLRSAVRRGREKCPSCSLQS